MATIQSGILGKARGRIGGLNLRQEKGVTIISSRAVKVKVSNSEKSIKNRSNFGICSKVCTAVRKIHIFYHLWKFSEVMGRTVSNKQISINMRLLKTFEDLPQIIFLPAENYFEASLHSCQISENKVTVVVNPIQAEVCSGKAGISAQGIIGLTDRQDDHAPEHSFLPIPSVMQNLVFNEPVIFNLTIPDAHILDLYTSGLLIINLITYRQIGLAAEASVNLVFEF